MKKIGIITIQKCDNFGADLQAYALGAKLRGRGFEAENIDYLFYKHPGHLSGKGENPIFGLSYSNPEGKVIIDPAPKPSCCISNRPVVEFVGPKFDTELDDEYVNCNALALVSHTENFGATVIDAMAYSKPVITSTNTPWRIVADRECGWWVNNDVESLRAAISHLFNLSASEIYDMGKSGKELVEEKYSWMGIGKQMVILYDIIPKNGKVRDCLLGG